MLGVGLCSSAEIELLTAYMLEAGPCRPTVDELSAPDVHSVFLQNERTSPVKIHFPPIALALLRVLSGSGKFSTRSHASITFTGHALFASSAPPCQRTTLDLRKSSQTAKSRTFPSH